VKVDSPILEIIICTNLSRTSLQETLQSLNKIPSEWFVTLIVPKDFNKLVQRDLLNICDGNGRVRVIKEFESGIYGAMQSGINNLIGNYVMFLNDDDILIKSSIWKIKNLLDTNPKADAFFVGYEKKIYSTRTETYLPMNNYFQIMKNGRMATVHQSQIWRSEILQELGGFNNFIVVFKFIKFRLRVCADFDLYCRALQLKLEIKSIPIEFTRVSMGGYSDIHYHRRIFETVIIVLKYTNTNLFKALLLIIKFELASFKAALLYKIQSGKLKSIRNRLTKFMIKS
jgi:hypothetical protein